MNNSLENLASICISEFMMMYEKDEYISKRQMDSFADKYHNLFLNVKKLENISFENKTRIITLANQLDLMIQKHNQNYLNKKMIELDNYFSHMFINVDANIKLDEEQKKAILIDEDYSLIVAGAGSGKTTTMAAKAKYLVEKCDVSPSEIILLSFTNKAVEELSARINDEFHLGIEVLTFHKLGKKLLDLMYEHPLKIIGEDGAYNIIVNYVKNVVFPNKRKLQELIETFPDEIHFDSLCFSYPSYDEYFKAYKEKRYHELKYDLSNFIKTRKDIRMESFRSINGELLKSKQEVRIANFLYENSILYDYEKLYKKKTSNQSSYIPDFTIYGEENEIYVEFYGLTKYLKNGTVSLEDVNQYNYYVRKKRELHKKYNTDLIELYSYYETNIDPIEVLKNELLKRGVILVPRTEEEIFNRLMDTSSEWAFLDFTKLISYFISQWKERLFSDDDFSKIEEDITDENLRKQFLIAKEIFYFYQKTIYSTKQIDFADMINFASRDLERVKDKCKYLNYKYIIVDEYQDISISRYTLMKKLSDLFQSKIVAVGDDWQSIFEFSGSELNLFTSFQNSLGYGEVIPITNTYRNSQELIDIAGDFISKNTLQYQKTLHSFKHLNYPIEIVYYEDKILVLEQIILNIVKEKPNAKILLLGRFKKDIEEFLGDKFFRKNNGSIGYKNNSNIHLTFLTVHASKGLGFDDVIVLNTLNDVHGFPSKIIDKPLIHLLKEKKEEEDIIAYPEERRLFYVALTRTKNKVYLLTSYNIKEESSFVSEIKKYYHVLENKSYVNLICNS